MSRGRKKLTYFSCSGSVFQREDVASVLVELFKQPRDAAKGLSLDLIQGETEIEEAVKLAVQKNESSFTD